MSNLTEERVKRKILKLLAMGNSVYEAEARTATQLAYRLMVEYGLTREDVGNETTLVGMEAFESTKTRKSEFGFISGILTNYFRVVPITQTTRYPRRVSYMIHGRKCDCEIAIYVANYLSYIYKELFRKSKLKRRLEYYLGLTESIAANLSVIKHEVEKEYGLIIVREKIITDFEATIKRNTRKISAMEGEGAYAKGVTDGKTVIIRKPLKDQSCSSKIHNLTKQ